MKTSRITLSVLFTLFAAAGLILSSCSPKLSVIPATKAAVTATKATATATVTPTTIPLPKITLKPGDNYFSVDGKTSFIFSRNLAGNETSQFYQLLDLTNSSGSNFVRVQLDSLGMGYTNTGKVDESWAKKWEDIFEKAASNGIYVMPVFGVWYDWNNGSGYSTWKSNPFNEKNGGPARTPAELFISDSSTQKLWLGWMKTLIERWQGQENIIAWDIFSEVNMAPGTTEPDAIEFVINAASIIQNADPLHHPVTASLADFGGWTNFYRSDSIDFINIHPYPVSGKLDSTIITEARSMLIKYGKPVLIGESGLSFETPDRIPPTLTTADRADIGIKHAIWAAVVSGSMNGRALWWEDGVAIYFPTLSLPFIQKYADADLPASDFVRGVDFSGFKPLTSTSSPTVWGAAVGNESMVLGWFRDAFSEPPDWIVQTVPAGQRVTLTIPGSAANWQVDFYDTSTGTTILSSTLVTRKGSTVTVTLPDFQDDIAFKMKAGDDISVITPEVVGNTNAIAGTWSGTIISTSDGSSMQNELAIQPDCLPGNICGTVTSLTFGCHGDLYLKSIQDATFTFVEQNMAPAGCLSGGTETLQLQIDGNLNFEFTLTDPDGTVYHSTGMLKQR